MTHPDRPLIHVVDDDSSMRTAVMRVLQFAGFDTRGYASAGEFLLADRGNVPGCVVLDVGLPGVSGMELQAALTRKNDPATVVFLTGRGDIEMSVKAMKAGAVDFLTKPVKRDVLLAAVNAAVARDVEGRARHEHLRALQARFDTLTNREREVLARVLKGRLNKQIADELGTSIRTIKYHRARVMEKMRVASLAELVRIADDLGEIISDQAPLRPAERAH